MHERKLAYCSKSSMARVLRSSVSFAAVIFLAACLGLCTTARIAHAAEPAPGPVAQFASQPGGLPGGSATNTGNTLVGCALTSNGAKLADSSTITTKAARKQNSYKVSFYDDNGRLLAEQTVQNGGEADYYDAYASFTGDYPSYDDKKCQLNDAYDFLPGEYGPTRSGYVFVGWDKSTKSIKRDTTLKAKYISKTEANKIAGVYSTIARYFDVFEEEVYYYDDDGDRAKLSSASGRVLYGTDTATHVAAVLKKYNALAKGSRRYCNANDIKIFQNAQARIDQFVATQKRDLAVGKKYTIKGIRYRITTSKIGRGGTVSVCAPAKKSAKKISIPKSIKISGTRLSVTAVSGKAFARCTKLKSLVIGAKVKKIGANALYGTKSLTKLVFKSNPTSISFAKKALNEAGKKKGKGLSVAIPKLKAKFVNRLHKAGLSKRAVVREADFYQQALHNR